MLILYGLYLLVLYLRLVNLVCYYLRIVLYILRHVLLRGSPCFPRACCKYSAQRVRYQKSHLQIYPYLYVNLRMPVESSGLLGADRFKMAARARSAPLGRSNWPLEPARPRRGARIGRSSPLGLAGALELAARARSASLGRSNWPLEPARPRWGVRIGRSSPLGLAGALDRTA